MSRIKDEILNLKDLSYQKRNIIIKNNDEYMKYLTEYYQGVTDNFAEMTYLFFNNMNKPKCEVCNNYVKWQGKGRYKTTCSLECGIKFKKQKTKLRKHEKAKNKTVDYPVYCKICGEVCNKMITQSHLNKHNITTKEYKEKYGKDSTCNEKHRKNLSSSQLGKKTKPMTEEQKKKISKTQKQKYASGELKAWNKGIPQTEEQKKQQSETMKQKYASGELKAWNKGGTVDIEVRNKISDSVKDYAKENKELLSNRSKLAFQTLKQRYGEEYIKDRHKNMIDSITVEGKEKQRQTIINSNKQKSIISEIKFKKLLKENGYTLIDYNKNTGIVEYKCPNNKTHVNSRNYFVPSFNDIKNNNYCKMCLPNNRSKAEIEIYEYICSLIGDDKVVNSNKTLIHPKELDIVIPEKKIAIEYNGLYWHSVELGKDKLYHSNKMDDCNKLGYDLIQIFEDEWTHKKEIVKSVLRNKLGIYNHKIFARKCKVYEIDTKVARKFLDKNHIYGYKPCKKKYGLYFNNDLVQVMTFSKGNKSRNSEEWEIDRFASSSDTIVVGGASKIFKRFLKDVQPEYVISYADLRYGHGNVYKNLGFQLDKKTVSGYFYFTINNPIRIHRYNLRKTEEEKESGKTEFELRSEQGYYRIYDCGHNKWIWKL